MKIILLGLLLAALALFACDVLQAAPLTVILARITAISTHEPRP